MGQWQFVPFIEILAINIKEWCDDYRHLKNCEA